MIRASERRALRRITADALAGVTRIPADTAAYWHALDTLHTARAHRRVLLTEQDTKR